MRSRPRNQYVRRDVQPSAAARTVAHATAGPRVQHRGFSQYGGGMPPTAQPQLGIENLLWEAANSFRGSLDSSDYKHVVLGLIFLKYMFDENKLANSAPTVPGPGALTWSHVVQAVESPKPAEKLDELVLVIERLNPDLASCFPRFSSYEGLAPKALAQLAEALTSTDLAASRSDGRDVLSRTYEYFLTKFAAAEGRLGGEFYTPQSIVRLMVGLLEPFFGTVYDPACGAGGLLVQAKAHALASGRPFSADRVVGQESNPMTWRLAKLNLALHGLNADLGSIWADTFTQDQHEHLKADFILTNPPFGKGTRWSRELLLDDARWQYGVPPANPANFAWLQHYLARLSDRGVAVTVMPNGPLTSRGVEGEIRASIIRQDLVECVIALPSQLFYSTPIPVSLWILTNDKSAARNRRNRVGETLFIDARDFGHLTSKIHRDLPPEHISRIISEYHSWQGRDGRPFQLSTGLSGVRTIAELARDDYSLNPSQFIAKPNTVDMDGLFDRLKEPVGATTTWLKALEPRARAASALLQTRNVGLSLRPDEASSWRTVRLGDVARVVGGGTPSTINKDYFGGDVQWVTPRDLARHNGRGISRGARSLTVAGLTACGAKLVPASAVLVSTRAPIGLVAISTSELATNQGIRSIIFENHAEHDPRFWYYLLRASAARLDAAGNGTTFRELRGSALGNMTFLVPEGSEQRRLAEFMSVLEDAAEAAQEAETSLRKVMAALEPGMTSGLIATRH